MATTPRTLRFEDDLYQDMKDIAKRPLTASYHIQEACRQYLKGFDKPVAKEAVPVAVKKSPVDYSVFGMSDDQVKELIRIRRKNKGGAITQRVANALSKEFHQACSEGFTFDELLTEWEVRGWKSFKAIWMKPNQSFGNKNLSSFEQTIESIKDIELPDMRGN